MRRLFLMAIPGLLLAGKAPASNQRLGEEICNTLGRHKWEKPEGLFLVRGLPGAPAATVAVENCKRCGILRLPQ